MTAAAPAPPSPTAGAGHDARFSLALFALALLPRLWAALTLAAEPVWDGHYYHFGAERIAAGLGYSEDVLSHGVAVWRPWCHYPVGYSAWLGLLYRGLGAELWVAPVSGAVVGAGVAVLAHRLARRFLSPGRARLAGLLVAAHPGLILHAALVMNEVTSAALLLGACAAAAQRPLRWRHLILAGVLTGAGTLMRPTLLAVAPLLALVLPGPAPRAAVRAAVITLVALGVTLPWTLRNCRVMDGCAFVSTNGGWNLAIGAVTETGRFTALSARDGCPVVTGQVQQDRCWAEVGRARILADPGRWLALIPKKLSHTFDHESFPVEYLREASPARWPEALRARTRHLLTAWHGLVLGLAVLGLVARPTPRAGRRALLAQGAALLGALSLVASILDQDPAPLWWLVVALLALAAAPLPGRPALGGVGGFLVATVALTALTHAVFFGDDRYHLVVSPALAILAAGALRRSPPPGQILPGASAPSYSLRSPKGWPASRPPLQG